RFARRTGRALLSTRAPADDSARSARTTRARCGAQRLGRGSAGEEARSARSGARVDAPDAGGDPGVARHARGGPGATAGLARAAGVQAARAQAESAGVDAEPARWLPPIAPRRGVPARQHSLAVPLSQTSPAHRTERGSPHVAMAGCQVQKYFGTEVRSAPNCAKRFDGLRSPSRNGLNNVRYM